MADIKAVEMNLAKDSLIAIAIRFPEYILRPVSLIQAALDESFPSKERKACPRRASCCTYGCKAPGLPTETEVQFELLPPRHPFSIRCFAIVRRNENVRFGIDEGLPVKTELKGTFTYEDTVNACQMVLDLGYCVPVEVLVERRQNDLCEMAVRLRWPDIYLKMLEIIADNFIYVERDYLFDGFAECRRTSLPLGCKPASGALHPHTEFRKSGSFRRNFS